MWDELERYARLSGERRLLLWEALLFLALARVGMALLPFRWIAAWLGQAGAQAPEPLPAAAVLASEVGWAVGTLGPRVPWDGRCLAQALAGTAMLRVRGLEGTVSFGGWMDASASFSAHAWLSLGSLMVTGGRGHERFQVFTTFSRKRK